MTEPRRDSATLQEIAPIAVRPSLLSGLSERMVVAHYENDYGSAVQTLNAVRCELTALDARTPPFRLRGLKRDELSLMGSVALHELYLGNLGGYRRAGPNSGLGRPDWHEVPDPLAAEIGRSGSGTRSQRTIRKPPSTPHRCSSWTCTSTRTRWTSARPRPRTSTRSCATFMRNINWDTVVKRIQAVRNGQPLPNEDPSWTTDMPSLSVEELAAQIANGSGVQIIDARQRNHMSRDVDLMAGATWRDPDRVVEWMGELKPDKAVAVYCAWGLDVGRNVTKTLIERGFDPRFVRGGLSAWYASGGARALKPTAG